MSHDSSLMADFLIVLITKEMMLLKSEVMIKI